ncbi:MAG: biosynthetic peptidoglycan transglycosylase [Myxococcota bacterium]
MLRSPLLRRALACAGALALAGFLLLRLGGAYAGGRALRLASARLGAPVSAEKIESRLGRLTFRDVRVGDRAFIREVALAYDLLPLLALRVHADVSARGASVRLGPDDRRPTTSGGGRAGRVTIRSVTLSDVTVEYADPALGLDGRARLKATWRPREPLRATLTEATARLRAGPEAAAERLEVTIAPRGQAGQPQRTRVWLHHGRVRALPGVELTGIDGWIAPREDGGFGVTLAGSYGSAGGRLWDASGWIRPSEGTQPHGLGQAEAELHVHGERFSLARVADALAKLPLKDLDRAELGGDLVLRQHGDDISFEGSVAASGLTLFGPRIGPVAVPGLAIEASVRGRFDPRAQKLALDEAVVTYAGVTAVLEGSAERLGAHPLLTARMRVPPVACQSVLDALPPALVPKLAGFRLAGFFEADVRTRIDFDTLAKLTASGRWRQQREVALGAVALDGKIALGGCRVLEAPPEADVRRLLGSFEHTMEVTPGHEATFVIGPENADFVPLADVSPYLVASLLTTEDSRFFEHRGFIPREFRSALARNLLQGRFAFGASSITMQMVKNVLLTREKTLARKLQELVLTWYVEQNLPKERTLEIYLNAIEFGPGIFGIGRAARHYFGKHARDLTPLESAFFSSILPSPKRRYEHYCRGRLSPKWEKYLPRILKRMHERARLEDAEYEEALAQTLVFDRAEAKPEKECLALVKKMVEASPDEPLDDLDLPFVDAPPPADAEPPRDEDDFGADDPRLGTP